MWNESRKGALWLTAAFFVSAGLLLALAFHFHTPATGTVMALLAGACILWVVLLSCGLLLAKTAVCALSLVRKGGPAKHG